MGRTAPETYDHTFPQVGAAVVRRRRSMGLRQEDLADLAGVSLRFVQFLEGGKPSVRLDKVEAVLEVLGLRLAVERAQRGTHDG